MKHVVGVPRYAACPFFTVMSSILLVAPSLRASFPLLALRRMSYILCTAWYALGLSKAIPRVEAKPQGSQG